MWAIVNGGMGIVPIVYGDGGELGWAESVHEWAESVQCEGMK